MKILETQIPSVKILVPRVYEDDRGFFTERFRDDWFRKNVENVDFVQDNHAGSLRGVLRGLHYQTTQTQGKLIWVVSGAIFDVVVDMRQSSPTFGRWISAILSSANKQQLWVPAGFAHGYLVLSESAEIAYKCTHYYHPESEVSVSWNDATINIDWPLSDGQEPILSLKDAKGLSFERAPKL